jgi:hypothetical protein
MAKTRLTKYDREQICAAIIAHKFDPIEASLVAEENALAIQARAKAYGDYLSVIDAAPKGAFCEDDSIDLNVGGRRIRLRFGASYEVRARIFAEHRNGYILSLPETDKFGAKALSLAERKEASRSERAELKRTLMATLGGFNSFDDLQAGWPEADRFIVARWQARGEYAPAVPAIAIRDLSVALDLPPDAAEAA